MRQRIKQVGLEGIDTASLREIVDIDPVSLQKIVAAIAAAHWTLRSERKIVRPESRSPAPMNDAQTALARQMVVERARKLVARTLKVSLSGPYIAPKPCTAALNPQKPVGRPRAMTEGEVVLARHMLAEGVTRKTIARTLKVSLSTLSIAVRPLNPKKSLGRPRAMTEAQIVLARLMLAEGVTREIIAWALKVSSSTLLNYLKAYGTGPHPQMRRPKRAPFSGRGLKKK
jgi:DNA-binding NarL/FixJ family response regulator